MELWQVVITIFSTLLGSSAFFGFIQYMINRKDERNKHIKDLEEHIKDLSTKVDGLADRLDMRCAIDSRTRILRAADEIRQGTEHSAEFFDQLHDDITNYEGYCKEHEDFKNNKSVNAIAYINQIYQKRLEKNDFL